jgi:hypothetical protein
MNAEVCCSETDRIQHEFSVLSVHVESDGLDESFRLNRAAAMGFVTPQKVFCSSASVQNLGAAIENRDFAALEELGRKLTQLARMGDLTGIEQIARANSRISVEAKFMNHNENLLEVPLTSSSLYSTPETVIAVPSSPISPLPKRSQLYPSKLFENRTSFSPYITSVKPTVHGFSSERVS